MQLASEDGFRADPPLVWRWYAWRRELVAVHNRTPGTMRSRPRNRALIRSS